MAALYLERGGRTLQTLPAFDDASVGRAAAAALRVLVGPGRERELLITKVDGLPVADSQHRAGLLEAGFVSGYRGLVLRGAGATTASTR